MGIIEEIKAITEAEAVQGKFSAHKDRCSVEYVIAERKAFLSKKKLIYIAKFRIDQDQKILRFTELLKETGFGLSAGSDSDMTTGFGFKKETYKTGLGARQGIIEEQSKLFSNTYSYRFDFSSLREKIKRLCADLGYEFRYEVFIKFKRHRSLWHPCNLFLFFHKTLDITC